MRWHREVRATLGHEREGIGHSAQQPENGGLKPEFAKFNASIKASARLRGLAPPYLAHKRIPLVPCHAFAGTIVAPQLR